jgi:hypothetical protein
MDEAHAEINYKPSARFCRIVAVFFRHMVRRLILWLALSVLFDEASYRKRGFLLLQNKTDVVYHSVWETVAP